MYITNKDIQKALKPLRDYREECKKMPSIGKRVRMDGVDCILHTPAEFREAMPVFLFLHGGSWVGGDAVLLDSLVKTVSDGANCVGVNINYTKLDKQPFPYAQSEVLRVIRYLTEHKDEMHINPEKMIISGASAGGHLAASTAIMAKDSQIPIARQILIYPFCDFSGTVANPLEKCGIAGVSFDKWETVFFSEVDKCLPYISPAAAPAEALKGIAPASIIICGEDSLKIHGAAYAKKLKNAGIESELKEYPEALHGFLEVNRPDFTCDNPAKNEKQAAMARQAELFIMNIVKTYQ